MNIRLASIRLTGMRNGRERAMKRAALYIAALDRRVPSRRGPHALAQEEAGPEGGISAYAVARSSAGRLRLVRRRTEGIGRSS